MRRRSSVGYAGGVIVRRSPSSLVLITQPDHAALARFLMERWQAGGLRTAAQRSSILHAIEEHDNGWREVDAVPVVEAGTGRVLDFITLPAATRQGVWPRGVARLAADPLAAALVAQHAMHIYSRFQGDPDWIPFFDDMGRLRGEYAQRADVSLEVVERLYPFVRAGDLLSLTFCTEWREVQHAADHEIRLVDKNLLLVHPDPFGGATVSFSIQARELPNRPFATPAEAADAFRIAPVVTLNGVARGDAHFDQ
jgi:uncharacterized protein DUF3891